MYRQLHKRAKVKDTPLFYNTPNRVYFVRLISGSGGYFVRVGKKHDNHETTIFFGNLRESAGVAQFISQQCDKILEAWFTEQTKS